MTKRSKHLTDVSPKIPVVVAPAQTEEKEEQFTIPRDVITELKLALMTQDRDQSSEQGAQAAIEAANLKLQAVRQSRAKNEQTLNQLNVRLKELVEEGGFVQAGPLNLDTGVVPRRKKPPV